MKLVETLAPPMMAITGLSARPALRQRVEFGLHGAAGIGGQLVAKTFGRGMGAVRRGKGVVDIEVAELGELATKAGSFFSSPLWKRVFSRQNVASLHRIDGFGGGLADAIVGEAHRLAEHCASAAATGFSDSLGSRPFGRPKCESRMTLPPLPEFR